VLCVHNTLGRGGASLSPCTPPDEEPDPVLTIFPTLRGLDGGNGCPFHHNQGALPPDTLASWTFRAPDTSRRKAVRLSTSTTVRRLDMRQRATLDPIRRPGPP
jgi:hypothetical protein